VVIRHWPIQALIKTDILDDDDDVGDAIYLLTVIFSPNTGGAAFSRQLDSAGHGADGCSS